jgi:hypothetical protein
MNPKDDVSSVLAKAVPQARHDSSSLLCLLHRMPRARESVSTNVTCRLCAGGNRGQTACRKSGFCCHPEFAAPCGADEGSAFPKSLKKQILRFAQNDIQPDAESSLTDP